MKKLLLVGAVGAGYVLGSRAGRQRYEQIAGAARKVASDPRVQRASARAGVAVKEGVTSAASSAADLVRGDTAMQATPRS
jgi:hypothetical protein